MQAQVNALGNPVSFFLTGGECADISVAPQLLEGVCECTVIADKGYDSEPEERHLVECFFSKIKEYCRVAIRYEKLAQTFLLFTWQLQ